MANTGTIVLSYLTRIYSKNKVLQNILNVYHRNFKKSQSLENFKVHSRSLLLSVMVKELPWKILCNAVGNFLSPRAVVFRGNEENAAGFRIQPFLAVGEQHVPRKRSEAGCPRY